MSNELLKIAGKASDETAKPFALDNDGHALAVRKWHSMSEILYPETEVRTDTYKIVRSENIRDYGLISLRIDNTLGVNIHLIFLKEYDYSVDGRKIMRDASSNNYLEMDIGQGYTIITPDEFPFLNYLEILCFQFKAESVPTEGTVKIWGVYKG